MKSTSELLEERAKDVFLELFGVYSISDIQQIGKDLKELGEKALRNPENTIASLSNGKIKF